MGKTGMRACEGARDCTVGNFLIARAVHSELRLAIEVRVRARERTDCPASNFQVTKIIEPLALDRPARNGSETPAMRNNTS